MKAKDIKKMNKEERMKKIEELELELIKAKASASKAGTSKIKEIKKVIARILTINNQEKIKGVEKH
jgi:large subunit ribosomal protein L29